MITLTFTEKGAFRAFLMRISVDNGKSPGACSPFFIQDGKIIERPARGRQFIYFVAACLTIPASYAQHTVEKNAETLRTTFDLFVLCSISRAAKSGAQPCCPHPAKKLPS
jgi:hypothetical protein